MSDRLPGSGWSNPIRHRGWNIALASYSPAAQFDWEAVHEDYDGDEDGRCIRAGSVEECKAEIDEREDDWGVKASCDSGSRRNGEDSRSEAEGEARQSGHEVASPKGHDHAT
jgi:hypothetical protein